jgi:MATE family multidrug resistance protein
VAGSNRIGNSLGARNPQQGRNAAFAVCIFGLGLGSMSATLLILFGNQWFQLYTNDPAVLDMIYGVLPIVAFYQINDGLRAVASGALQGCGLQVWGAKINIFGYYIVGFPMAAVLTFYFDMGLYGLWWGMLTAMILVSLLETYFLLVRVDWIEQSILAIKRSRGHSDTPNYGATDPEATVVEDSD